jgi:hypothetical protein
MEEREAHIEGKYLVDSATGETLGRTFIKDGVRYVVPLTYPLQWKDAKKIVHDGFVYIRATDINLEKDEERDI